MKNTPTVGGIVMSLVFEVSTLFVLALTYFRNESPGTMFLATAGCLAVTIIVTAIVLRDA